MVFAVAVTPITPVEAEPSSALCQMSTQRGDVPESFAIEACVDGSNIWLRNSLDVPVRFEAEGDADDPVTVEINQTPAAMVARAIEDRDGLLLPGDIMRIPIGEDDAAVTLADTDAGGPYVLATTLATFLPTGAAGSVINAVTELVVELSDVMAKFGNCMYGANWLQQLGCRTVLSRDVAFAIGRAGVTGLGGAAVSLIASVPTYLQFLAAQPSAIRQVLGSERTLSQIAVEDVPPAPLTVDTLAKAPVPSLCEHPAGALVDGALPDIPESDGGVWLFYIGWSLADGPQDQLMALGDLDRDGTDEAVVTIGCFRGGVSWPDTVHVYTAGPTGPEHRAVLDLGEAYDTGWENREHVQSISIDDDGIFTVDWSTHVGGDAMCCPSLVVRGTFALSGTSIENRGVEVIEDTRLPPDMTPGSYPEPSACAEGTAPTIDTGEDGASFAAMCLYSAFAFHDPDIGRRYALPAVVDSLFVSPWPVTPQDWRFHGCRTDSGVPAPRGILCTFTTEVAGSGSRTVIDVRFAASDNRMMISDVAIGPEVGD